MRLLILFLCDPAEEFPGFPAVVYGLRPGPVMINADVYLQSFRFRDRPPAGSEQDMMFLGLFKPVISV